MSQSVLDISGPARLPRRGSGAWLLAFMAGSLALHGGALAVLHSHRDARPAPRPPVELVMVEVAKPPPPPPPEVKEAPKPAPPPPRARPVPPPPVKVAEAARPPPPPDAAPPPPNDAPAPTKTAPLVVGLSLSSTTAGGGFAAPVGNTLYGKTGDKAVAPKDVKGYGAPKYTPIYQVDREPQLASEVKIPYPEEARRAGVEGTVTLALTIDTEGRVVNVRVLSGPGSGLDEAARDAIRRFRFTPAFKGGEAVSTELKYAYTFLLD
ncbi:energy transducer TonB [Corallococcus sp. Z5C101001]|uniref:energy transducer TonB n=1 Tax=Corallococcus sp. Z5C101001 TaxID=2596829 RepID=UPI00117D3089|nr:energy transducer TonB [Corallococcus sp. Z5C101001]TSC24675.1 energy transducer TonB [Corallococcus sp. Z5C101001]